MNILRLAPFAVPVTIVVALAACQPAAELSRLILDLPAITKLPERVATPLYLGTATDTGWFRHSNVDRAVMTTAGDLIAAGAILVFVPAIGTVLEPTLLGGGKQMVMGTLIQTQFGGGRNWPFGAAVALVLMAMVMVVLIVTARRAGRLDEALA